MTPRLRNPAATRPFTAVPAVASRGPARYPFYSPDGLIAHSTEGPSVADSQLAQTIHTHTFPNGLVLLAEPMRSLESAAFTIRVPGGFVNEPDDRGGLGVMTMEMSQRGAGERDSRQLVDLL